MLFTGNPTVNRKIPAKIALILLLNFKFLIFNSFAQYCIPSANCSDNDIIDNFVFNTISNLFSGGSNCNTTSYINTGLSTTVTIGVKYPIAVQAGPAFPQGFGVWIDYNQDIDFNDPFEFVYASPSASNSWFNDSIIISSSAIPGTTRLRVRSQYNQTVTAGESCSAFTWGETEDYTVVIQANTLPPSADFTVDTTFTCNGNINFVDQSLNVPTSWLWNFGDSTTSALQNPSHIYSANGTYTVSLTATNSFGTNSITKINYITVLLGGPITPSCTPATTAYCCQMGIVYVGFAAISSNSGDGSEGYSDFSCTNTANVTMNQSYTIFIQTGPNFEENVNVWIDYNNNGAFSGSELVFSSFNNLSVHTGTILISSNPVTQLPLRMRVGSDWWSNPPPLPCTAVQYGQFEDYTVIIQPDTIPPVTNFIADATMSCNGVVNFTDLSTNNPTSWLWNFGDGNTDTAQNPTHTYTTDSVYTVTLVATNQYGSDTFTIVNYITVNTSGGGPIPPTCIPNTLTYCCGFGILSVIFNSITSVTNDGVSGYENLVCMQGTNVTEGQTYTISIDVSGASPGKQNVRAWIDYNNDGSFNNSTELVFSANNTLNATGPIIISPGGVLNTPLRMRISADYDFEAVPTPCSNLVRGQAEDYTITVLPNTAAPIAAFSSDTLTCDGTVVFVDQSANVPTFWLWNFGDGDTSNLQNPAHTYTADGLYTVTLTVANPNGSDTLIAVDYITVSLNGGPVSPSCLPATLSNCCGYGIFNVTLNGLSNSSGNGSEGYMDFSCIKKAYLREGQSYPISVITGFSNPQDTRVWIDFNNDGLLDDVTERVFTANDKYNPSGFVFIPLGVVKDTTLRMRVSSDFSGSLPGPCTDLWYGQAEDYGVVIGDPPSTSFSISDSSFCEGSCISFTDLSSNDPTSWIWSFPGATPASSTAQNPTNICYSTPGAYNVNLTAANPFGTNVLTLNSVVTVLSCPPPVSDFNSSQTTICRGECISFTDLSINNPGSWSWFFPGAGTASSSDQNPSNICYANAGTFNVTLITSNINGSDSITKAGYITVNSCPPAASFTVNNSNVCEGACLNFTDQTTNNPTSWSWLFSGGVPDTSSNKNPSSICYSTPGTYEVTLIVENGSGSDTLIMPGYITISSCPPPISNFAPGDSEICTGNCIGFTDMSQYANTWFWTFSGAAPATSFLQNPTNICFNSPPGQYEVRLITNNASGTDTIIKTVTVDSAVAAMLVNDTLFVNLPSSFTDNSSNNPVAWTWYFGDGNFTNLQNPVYTYTSTGQYTITLVVVNDNGCVDTATKLITVVKYTGVVEAGPGLASTAIFPNPTSGIVFVKTLNMQTGSLIISVENIVGQKVYGSYFNHVNPFTGQIDLSDLSPGIYYLTLSNEHGRSVRKIIKY